MPRSSFLPLLAILAALAGGAHAQTYRWVDSAGRVHYSDQPPPAEAKQVEQKNLGANVVETSGQSYETREAASKFPVVLYTSDSCGVNCEAAREFLGRHKVPFRERVLKTAADMDAYKQGTGLSDAFVPTLSVGRQVAKGYQESEWQGLLDAAGYPK